MRFEKKETVKPDGRYLVYYHFPDTASETQATAFANAETEPASPAAQKDVSEPPSSTEPSPERQAGA